jgi:hypothetical protein
MVPGKYLLLACANDKRTVVELNFTNNCALSATAVNVPRPAPIIVTHVIDSSIYTGPASIPDAGRGLRPLVAVADAKGIVSAFISNEVLLQGTKSQLNAFLTKYQGTVLATIIPPPPRLPAYDIRLDASNFSLQNLDANLGKILSFSGQIKFSSDLAARLSALVASEETGGTRVALNFVSEAHDFIYSATEQSDLDGVSDAFKWPEFYSKAWQFLAEPDQASSLFPARVPFCNPGNQ